MPQRSPGASLLESAIADGGRVRERKLEHEDAHLVTIQTGMLVALGFLAASLLALLVAPAFWSRAVRLTTRRIKETMPLTDVEIRADKDRIRAEYAIKVHKLESQVEQVRLAGARQQIEINRRDASINELEGSSSDSRRATKRPRTPGACWSRLWPTDCRKWSSA